MNKTSISRLLVFALFAAGMGGLAVHVAGLWVGAAPDLQRTDYLLNRAPDDPVVVEPSRPMQVPWPRGDFDLFAQLELASGSELDLLFRVVLPQKRGTGPVKVIARNAAGESESLQHSSPGSAQEAVQEAFHARFASLRLSTVVEGPALLTREEALFGTEAGGLLLDAGRPATIVMEGRGDMVRANVAGVWLDWMKTSDAYGGFAFISRSGNTLVRSLQIKERPDPLRLMAWAWGVILGGFAGLVIATTKASLWRLAMSCLVMPVAALFGGSLILGHLLQASVPEVLSVVMLGLSGLPLACIVALRARPVPIVLGLIAVLCFFEAATRVEALRLAPLEDGRLHLYFGGESGMASIDALSARITADTKIHTTASEIEDKVMFVGGSLLFETSVYSAKQLGLLRPNERATARKYSHAIQTEELISEKLGKRIECIVMPTKDANALQQRLLLERFYIDAYAPKVVVLGLLPWELEPAGKRSARTVFDGETGPFSGFGSVLLSMWRGVAAGDVPLATIEELRASLDALAALGEAKGFTLITYESVPGLPGELRAELAGLAERQGGLFIPYGAGQVDALAEAVAGALRR